MNASLTNEVKYHRCLAIETYFGNAPGNNLETKLKSIFTPCQRDSSGLLQLRQELKQLICFKQSLTDDSPTFIEDLYNSFFEGEEYKTNGKAKDLLRTIYWEFEASQVVQKLAERFEISKTEFLEWDAKIDWFCLWAIQTYPNLILLLLKPSQLRCFYALEFFELEATILHLPKFMLFNLRKCLSKKKSCRLLIELASGMNVRYAQHCPFPFSKKMAHYFSNAPKEYKLETAIWYAMVIGQEGTEPMLEGFQRHFRSWRYNITLIQILIDFFKKPANHVEAEELRPLLSYLQHLWDEEGSLNLKGWTLNSLRRRERTWQETLRRQAYQSRYGLMHLSWPGAPYQDLENERDNIRYKIIQLTTAEALFNEGWQMHHCVGSYALKCYGGMASIWSLRQECSGIMRRLVTIELDENGRIVQAKGKYNAQPSTMEWELIRKWVAQEKLLLAS